MATHSTTASVGTAAPDFALPDASGATVTLDDCLARGTRRPRVPPRLRLTLLPPASRAVARRPPALRRPGRDRGRHRPRVDRRGRALRASASGAVHDPLGRDARMLRRLRRREPCPQPRPAPGALRDRPPPAWSGSTRSARSSGRSPRTTPCSRCWPSSPPVATDPPRIRTRPGRVEPMRISIFGGEQPSLDAAVDAAGQVEAEGFHGFHVPQIFGFDALTTLAVVGRQVPRHRARHRRGPHLSPAPDDARRAGAHHADGVRRPAAARHRPLAPGRHRVDVRHVVREARTPHARVPVDPHAAPPRRARRVHR